jgi:hypothetical protein
LHLSEQQELVAVRKITISEIDREHNKSEGARRYERA